MRSVLLQLSVALVLCLMQDIQQTYTSASSLSNMIAKTCNYDENGNKYVEVSILQTDIKSLSVASVNSLRLWGNGSHCRHRSCCNGEGWMWRFNGSQCGSQLLVDDDNEIISNVLYIEEKNSTSIRNPKSDMAMITCNFPSAVTGSASQPVMDESADKVTMPKLSWSVYRTDGYIPFPDPSAAVTFNPTSTYVGDWTEGNYLLLLVQAEDIFLLQKAYKKNIQLAVYSCSFNLIHEGNGSQQIETKPLITKGCPVKDGSTFFGAGDAYHYLDVAVVIDIAHEADHLGGSDVNFAFLTCTASLCRDHGVNKYEQVPRCPGYEPQYCYQEMEDANMSLSDYYVSGLLKMQTIGTPSPSTVQTLPERFTSTPTPTPTGVDTEVNDGKLGSDRSVVLSPFLVAVVCLSCLICGCTLVAVPCIIQSHFGRRRTPAPVNKDETVEQGQYRKVAKCDALSLDSGIPGSSASSPVKLMSSLTFDSQVV